MPHQAKTVNLKVLMGHCIFSQTPTLNKVAVFARTLYNYKVNFNDMCISLKDTCISLKDTCILLKDTCILLKETKLDVKIRGGGMTPYCGRM